MALFLLCLKVFFVRILDVSLGTIRTIVTIKGQRIVASLIGFVEVFVWFVIVNEALNTSETSIWIAVFYAGGFATGTYIGSFLSDIFIQGNLGVQVITSRKDNKVIEKLRNMGYGVSVIDVKGRDVKTEKYMLFIEIDKKHLKHLKQNIKKLDNDAFIVVNETKFVQNGYFEK